MNDHADRPRPFRGGAGHRCTARVPASTTGCASPAAYSETLLESGHAPVNGIRMYYEVHGRRDGVPLVLLHGGVRKLVFASAMTKREGAYPQLWEFMEQADFSNMTQPLKDAFLSVNPDIQQLRTMHDKDAARMSSFEDVPDEVVRSIRAATLVLIGDRDIVKLEHAVELTRLIPEARLLILPSGHGDYLGEIVAAETETHDPELTARLVERFLATPLEEG